MREAVVRIPMSEFRALGLEEFVSLCGEAGLRGITELVCTGPGGILAVQVEHPFQEEQLSALDYVEWWERVDQLDAGIVYLLKLTMPGLPKTLRPQHELGIANRGIRITKDGLDISLIGDQKALNRLLEEYNEAGFHVLLQKVSDYRGPESLLDSLTTRQRHVVRTAFRMGYFDVPRRISIADIAAELELDSSTVSEHLQRAERNLLTQMLGSN